MKLDKSITFDPLGITELKRQNAVRREAWKIIHEEANPSEQERRVMINWSSTDPAGYMEFIERKQERISKYSKTFNEASMNILRYKQWVMTTIVTIAMVIAVSIQAAKADVSSAQAEWMANQCQTYYNKNMPTLMKKYGNYKSYARWKEYDNRIRIYWHWIAPWGERIIYNGGCQFDEITWQINSYYSIQKTY